MAKGGIYGSDARALIHDLDYSQDPVEECYRRGWTDGMPVAPPTVEKVNQMLDYVGLSPGACWEKFL
ncbi:MAG: hypothetical protein CM1200mP15_21270 [Dehalococcoidia bacterium]|nr:MAG: hypothetical protein CM1200mP15_21270 [Dehalococcoidia bacterium]